MVETDTLWMTALIFLPTAVALLLMIPWLFPRGSEEYMKWVALAGTAATLAISIIVMFGFYRGVIDFNAAAGNRSHMLLSYRAEQAREHIDAIKPAQSGDWVTILPWIPRFNIHYYLGLDGISMPLVLLTTGLSFLAMIASWRIDRYVRGYCILFLILETGMIGTFLALDLFLFYIFWEVMLLPMYFLIGLWGGPRREYAAIKFFLYTLLGSVFILIAILGFYFTDVRDFVRRSPMLEDRVAQILDRNPNLTRPEARAMAQGEMDKPVNTFDMILLQRVGKAAAEYLNGQPVHLDPGSQAVEVSQLPGPVKDRFEQPFFSRGFQYAMFLLLFVGFAIKVPVFPFHTWLPDAHVEAPTPISMILAGVLLKMGGYGIIRIAYPICPWAAEQLAWWVGLFGIINIVYGAFAAMAQTDFKRLVAYSSVSHMGYVILGIAVWSASGSQYWSWAMNGAMFQMIAHGITSAGMFFLVGVIYDRAHHRDLNRFRGLFEPMPLYGGIAAIIFFAAMGLPSMCGFVGEFMVILGTWNFSHTFAVLAALTVVLTAAYILWTLQRVYLGTNPAYKDYPDIDLRELTCIVPLVIFSVLLGVLPSLLLSWMEPSVTGLVDALARLGG